MIPKFYVGPMSKNIVDTAIDYCNQTNSIIGLIPSRRQIEFDGGYVNNWTTEQFTSYIRSKTDKILLVRDHAGPNQGNGEDDGYESLNEDCKFFDVIHIDPWKKYYDLYDGINETIKMIEFCFEKNSKIVYEVGTEESIRKFTPKELEIIVDELKIKLSDDKFKMIKFLVIQSGTSLKETNQTGQYDKDRLKKMLDVCKKYNLYSKEHNGDYISMDVVNEKFNLGLNSINIAPEFGVMETTEVLKCIDETKNDKFFNDFFQICLNSNRWKKWVSDDFNIDERKREIILISGHYVFSNYEFINLKKHLTSNLEDVIKQKLYNKFELMLNPQINYLKKLISDYFEYFSEKNILALSNMFADNVKLKDWEISAEGKNQVIQTNLNIFNSVETIKVTLNEIYKNELKNNFSCAIDIKINNSEVIKVIDIICFNEDNKIESISAYKQ